RGDRVDIWGPIRSRYMAPRDLDAVEPDPALHEAKWIGGTSAAAPYISGLIADMMALAPSLHPLNPALTANQLRAIPQRVRDLLVNTAWTQDELEDRGFLDLDAPVRNLVRPPAALRRAAEAAIPLVSFGMLGFTDDEINFGETALVDRMDFPLWSHDLGVLDAQREFSHTILTLPGELPSRVESTDVDWISYTMPEEIVWLTDPFGISRPQIRDGYYNAIIQLLTPATFGELTIEGDGREDVSRGTESPHPLVTLREFRTPLLFNN